MKCVFADCDSKLPSTNPVQLRRAGWRPSVGHDDVWICPKCLASLKASFDKKRAGQSN